MQVGDIHFGQEVDGTLVVHEDVRGALIADAAALARDRGRPDLVLAVGDIAYSGKREEYQQAGKWLDNLTQAVGCQRTDVRVVPGNHDCDWSRIGLAGELLHQRIRQGTPKSVSTLLDRIARESPDESQLLAKQDAYREFAAGYSCDFSGLGHPFWTLELSLERGIALKLLGMNSALVSDKSDSPGKMVLGNAQYARIERSDHALNVVILHHPLTWLLDKDETRNFVASRSVITLVGHEHLSRFQKTVDERGRERLELYSGATNPPQPGGEYRHTYNWLEVGLGDQEGGGHLVVRVLPRVWVPTATRFEADIQRLEGRGVVEFDISCPDLNVTQAAPDPTTQTHGSVSSLEGAITTERDSMATLDDAAVSRLKLLFWRHLTWQQRLTVLVRANVLPVTADKRIPQTLEQVALEQARASNRLGAVWDAMMEYVPPDERETNPFPGHEAEE